MVELVVSIVAASAPTLSYLIPSSMKSQNHPSQNSASKLSAGGVGSHLGKHNYGVGVRPLPSEDADSEEDERRIIVKDEIEMKWQGKSGSLASNTRGSATSWYDENNTRNGPAVYDGSDRRQSNQAWVSTGRPGRGYAM
jgi:hypothetical protein